MAREAKSRNDTWIEERKPITCRCRTVAVGGAIFVSIASVAEFVLALQPTLVVSGPSWLILGGFPVLNWNLPFGALTAVGYLMIWSAYRGLRDVSSAWPRDADVT